MPQPVFVALGRGFAGQGGVAVVPVPVQVIRVPVGVGRQAADQLVCAVAHHVAHGGVHVDDAAFEVARAHADQQRVFHRLAKCLRLLQCMGAFLDALLQFDAGLPVLLQAPFAQLPVQGTEHQQARRQARQCPGLLTRQGDGLAVGREGQRPAQVGQALFKGQIALAGAGHEDLGAWLAVALERFPGHGLGCPACAILLVELHLLHVLLGQWARGLVQPGEDRAEEDNAALIGHEDRVAQLRPGVHDGLHPHLHGHDADHPAVFHHGCRCKKPRFAGGLAHAVKPPRLPLQCIAEIRAIAVVLVHEAGGGVPVAGGYREPVGVHHIQRVRACIGIDGLQVGIGGAAQRLGTGVAQQLGNQRLLRGGEWQVAVAGGHAAQGQGLHLARAAQVVPLVVEFALGRPLSRAQHQEHRQPHHGRHGARAAHCGAPSRNLPWWERSAGRRQRQRRTGCSGLSRGGWHVRPGQPPCLSASEVKESA
ncbi:hypothetical protein D3C71_1137200 [compost metagenome]